MYSLPTPLFVNEDVQQKTYDQFDRLSRAELYMDHHSTTLTKWEDYPVIV
jgi:hypothetical protein